MKPKLPIEDISESNFEEFKNKYFDKERLDEEAIQEIKRLFKIGDSSVGGLCCDEYHAHMYKCFRYYRPETGIVERLISEIENQRDLIRDIHEKTSP